MPIDFGDGPAAAAGLHSSNLSMANTWNDLTVYIRTLVYCIRGQRDKEEEQAANWIAQLRNATNDVDRAFATAQLEYCQRRQTELRSHEAQYQMALLFIRDLGQNISSMQAEHGPFAFDQQFTASVHWLTELENTTDEVHARQILHNPPELFPPY